jgi:SAM-dependent MidA family methyltransferase
MSHVCLPQPNEAMLVHSHQLLQKIIAEIKRAPECSISFARFMKMALYTPGLGYYSAGCFKLGNRGDFVTAPEISSLFGRCLAKQCLEILSTLTHPTILELGAGTGKMARDILLELDRQNALPESYLILEISADLKQRQQTTLQTLSAYIRQRIVWLNQLPLTPINGIILANEVLDALPTHKFFVSPTGVSELRVGYDENSLVWKKAPFRLQAREQIIADLQQRYFKQAQTYESEINLQLPAWLKSINAVLDQGVILIIDYGFPNHEYYYWQRNMGTLACHYQQHVHFNPLILVGLQDITAHVDFSWLVQHALRLNLNLLGFTSQAAFLLSCGLLEFVEECYDARVLRKLNNQIHYLTSPNEMGELFKVLALGRDHDQWGTLKGFKFQDRRLAVESC